MTLYIMYGFAKAAEFGVDVPKDMVQRGWQLPGAPLPRRVPRPMRWRTTAAGRWLTFLNYVASSYPDAAWTGDALTADERKEMLDFSFKHWKQHSPLPEGHAGADAQARRPRRRRASWCSTA